MKSYLFAVFLLTVCVVFVESAPTQNDESPPGQISTLVCDLGVTPKSGRRNVKTLIRAARPVFI